MTRLRDYVPPEALRVVGDLLQRRARFVGDYPDWASAEADAEGYSADQILAQAKIATLFARDNGGEERDGVLLARPSNRFPLLCGVLHAAAFNAGRVRVIDFGGALGGTYFACRKFLADLDVLWTVVEQPHYVDCGKANFETDRLRFAYTLDEAVQSDRPDVVLFSSVLQYLPDPAAILQSVVASGVRQVIIDRTPVVEPSGARIAIQKVRYPVRSSYPIHLMSREQLLAPLSPNYKVTSEFETVDPPMGDLRRRIDFSGFLLERAQP